MRFWVQGQTNISKRTGNQYITIKRRTCFAFLLYFQRSFNVLFINCLFLLYFFTANATWAVPIYYLVHISNGRSATSLKNILILNSDEVENCRMRMKGYHIIRWIKNFKEMSFLALLHKAIFLQHLCINPITDVWAKNNLAKSNLQKMFITLSIFLLFFWLNNLYIQ
jgi:hypothetical protein